MKNFKTILAVLALSSTLTGCNTSTNQQAKSDNNSADSTSAITVNPLQHAKDFPGASLSISSLTSEKAGADSAKVTVKYAVKNFNLTEQTEHSHHMANSHEGQHIHFILDNTPYVALYKPEHSVTLPINSEHYLLSFLSRSFHESIKTADASKLIKFKINADGKIEELPVPSEPSLFFSRPKGDYKGADANTLLLDFFVTNTTLGANENKVKAEIEGQEFILDQWIPYEILNLPMGENIVKLTLIDSAGNPLSGENVSVERKINLSAE